MAFGGWENGVDVATRQRITDRKFTYEKKRRPHNITTNLKNTNASDKAASYITPSNRNVCPGCCQLVGEEYVGVG